MDDNILEYQTQSFCHTLICDNKEVYVASEINKWLFPKKSYFIKTGIKVWLPKNSIAILFPAKYLNPKLEVIPQIITNDGFIIVQVRNTSLLPVKISEEEILASLHIISTLEYHIVNIKGSLE